MNRGAPTLNQLLSWSVPILLVLLLLPSAPTIIRDLTGQHAGAVVAPSSHRSPRAHHEHGTSTSKTTPSTSTTHEHAGSSRPATNPTTTTTVAHSSSGTSANDANSEGTDTVFAPSGVLAPPATSAQQPLGAGTSWDLSATGPVTWSLACGSTVVSSDATPINVPADSVDCVVTISTTATTEVAWQLNPVN